RRRRAKGLSETPVVFLPANRVEEREQGPGDFVQPQGTFRLVRQLVSPDVSRTTEGRLLDDLRILLVRRDVKHLVIGAGRLPEGDGGEGRNEKQHEPFSRRTEGGAETPAGSLLPLQ